MDIYLFYQRKNNLGKLQTQAYNNPLKIHKIRKRENMDRNIDLKLLGWKTQAFRKPLLIRGARQVGKTYSVSTFGKNSFESFIKLDFERNQSIHKIFNPDLSVQQIIRDIEIFSEQKITPGKTLLFFDEIQECERALLSLRYFYEDMPELHVKKTYGNLEEIEQKMRTMSESYIDSAQNFGSSEMFYEIRNRYKIT